MVAKALAKNSREDQRKEIQKKYTELINRSTDAIKNLKPQIEDCEEQLELLKNIVHAYHDTSQ